MATAESAPVVTTPTPSRSLIIAVTLPLMYFLFGLSWMSFIPAMPEVKSALGVDDVLLTVFIVNWVKAVVPILAGIVAARIGLTTTMRLAGALILVGAAAPWLPEYWAVIAARFAFGVGGAVWVTLMGPVVMAVVPAQQRSMANAVNAIAVNVGIVVAWFTTLPLVELLGWRTALSLGSLGSAVVLVVVVAVGKLGADPAKIGVGAMLLAYWRSLKLSTTWILALAFMGTLSVYLAFNAFLGTHLEQSGIPRSETRYWMSFLNICGVPASFASGFLLRKFPKPNVYLIIASVLVPLGVAGGIMTDAFAVRVVCFACIGVGMFLPVSPLITAVQKLPGQTPSQLAMVLGTMFSVTYIVSTLIPTVVSPLLARGWSLQTLLICVGALGASPIAGLLLSRKATA